MDFEREFPGPNYGYVFELYDRDREKPDSVDQATRTLFDQWKPTGQVPSVQAGIDLSKLIGVVSLAKAIRSHGYLARLDPLGSRPAGDPKLSLDFHSLDRDDAISTPLKPSGCVRSNGP